jgi:hypothetical protein
MSKREKGCGKCENKKQKTNKNHQKQKIKIYE